ncbi:SGNH hydrolase-type esterase domain-containing protein [Xylariaceae sp. FL0804]|nr:SGNH hydrolase-type esterase domain-containing protein [Xylariaceae sp. FL0804]
MQSLELFHILCAAPLAAAAAAAAASATRAVTETPKLLICSDSTTANYDNSSDLQGWGYYIGDYLSLPVSNQAKNGRSTRSFINEGLWAALLSNTSAGDLVLIEMGHNDDDGDPTADPDDRATLPGVGNATVLVTNSTGDVETVHTFGWYLRAMVGDVRAVEAVPVLSGMVNRNYWTGDALQPDWPFADYAQEVAVQMGVEFVNHTGYSVEAWQSMGPTEAKTYYPDDNTHTNWPGARINAETFVQAVKYHCDGDSILKQYLNAKAADVKEPAAQPC